MSFTNFSQIVQPAPWVDPINLDLLRQGNMYKEEIARQNLLNLSESFQALASTPAYGKDAEKLQEKLQELKSQISGLNLSDVSDYNTMGQIKGVINQFSSNPDIMDIAQKWTPVQQEQERKRKAEEKGEMFISPLLDSANEYIQQGEYKKGVRFGSSGWLSPNTEKMKTEALKNIKPDKKTVKVGNYWQEQEFLSKEKVKPVLDEIYSNPAVIKDMEYKIEQSAKREDVNFADYGRKSIEKAISEQQALVDANPNNQDAKNKVQLYSTILNDPNRLAASAKQIYLNDKIEEEKQKDLAQLTYVQEGKMDADNFALNRQQQSDRIALENLKYAQNTGVDWNTGQATGRPIETSSSGSITVGNDVLDAPTYVQVIDKAFEDTNNQAERDKLKEWAVEKYNKVNPNSQIDANEATLEKNSNGDLVLSFKKRVTNPQGEMEVKQVPVATYNKETISVSLPTSGQKIVEQYNKAKKANENLPATPNNYKHKATSNGITLYSQDKKKWYDANGGMYDKDGKKIQ